MAPAGGKRMAPKTYFTHDSALITSLMHSVDHFLIVLVTNGREYVGNGFHQRGKEIIPDYRKADIVRLISIKQMIDLID